MEHTGQPATLGLIVPDSGPAVLPEHEKLMPAAVRAVPVYVPLPGGEVTAEALNAMVAEDSVEEAARALARQNASCVLFACTSGSLLHGAGWEAELTARLSRAAGVPALTTAAAVLRALTAVQARQLALITPYLSELDHAEKAFFEAAGFEVRSMSGPRHRLDADIDRLGPADLERCVDRLDLTEIDTVFVSCTSWRVLDAVAGLESRYGIRVVTSNQASAWAALRTLGEHASITGYGHLLHQSPQAINAATTPAP